MKNLCHATSEFDLTQTTVLYIRPEQSGGFIVPDSIEGIVQQLTGTVVTVPTISLGILGDLAKYLDAVPLSEMNALYKAHRVSTLDSAEGATMLVLTINPAGEVSAGGMFTGDFVIRGIQS